jgi:hypothetical protein
VITGEFIRCPGDHRIDEINHFAAGTSRIEIDHCDPLRYAHLNRSKTNPVRLIHGLDHVIHETAELFVEVHNRLRHGFEARVRRCDEFKNGHGRGR